MYGLKIEVLADDDELQNELWEWRNTVPDDGVVEVRQWMQKSHHEQVFPIIVYLTNGAAAAGSLASLALTLKKIMAKPKNSVLRIKAHIAYTATKDEVETVKALGIEFEMTSEQMAIEGEKPPPERTLPLAGGE